ncbi:restriction endonuclease [Treponema medium]|uniref:5-methylcytosine-specific restriction enzyme subunit McrC n=2 Tax=Treponema medium TaxID=58231 RepID=A0AA87NSQ7_TREMD|nr:hypothetical protein [Treponema medium]EPF29270.1 hypothetical protein HMPREF9195_00778 [Treponema medium ATCC 700293]QSH91790.1 restriction endonuclease [Treponema medium]QSH96919.1 restriction endonuclease [Treponema medium]
MRTTDNNGGKLITELFDEQDKTDINDLAYIANRTLAVLQEENPDLLIFPHSLGHYHDDIESSSVFDMGEETITTHNIMGFVGRNTSRITITSRFAKNDQHDYFLHYMLQKVLSIYLLNFDQTRDKENIWNFLLYLFPYYLKKAYSQGLYKAYKRQPYNDINLKGALDIQQHIHSNIPFTGKIAYIMRERSVDNPVTQLIRHTIEVIKNNPRANSILTRDSETLDIVRHIIFTTQHSYNKHARQKIISLNMRYIAHPYYTEYTMLQKICLKILRHENITFGNKKDKIYGLVFDGAWLWEEYLNTILHEIFIHPENKTRKHRCYLFEHNGSPFQAIYPDFISKNKPKIVGDAKYIPLDNQKEYSAESQKAVSIYYKTISYMYRFNAMKGIILFPTKTEKNFYEDYTIIDTNGILKKIGLAIPQSAHTFADFIKIMHQNEQDLLKNLLLWRQE